MKFKYILFLIAIALNNLVNCEAKESNSHVPPVEGYQLVWSDEFEGDALDLSKWDYRNLGKRRDAINVKDAVTVKGGHLVLTTKSVEDEYHTAMIGTQGKFETTFGYFECRVKLQRQIGHWSAFWLQSPTLGNPVNDSKSAGTEIDIFEYLRKRDNKIQHTLHWDGYGKYHKSATKIAEVPELTQGWHTVGLLWSPTYYAFYVDGKETWQTSEGLSHRPQYMILSLEVGKWAGEITRAELPDSLLVDYVRVYKKSRSHSKTKPVSVLFDTDMDSDVDDVGALAVLHALADKGEAEILGVIVTSDDRDAPACADAINTYFHRPDIPIGVNKKTKVRLFSRYTKGIAQEYPHDLESFENAEDATSLYRRILVSQEDDSVTIITVGHLTNLKNLLAFGDGSNQWRPSPDKDHGYLVEKTAPGELSMIIDRLMIQGPAESNSYVTADESGNKVPVIYCTDLFHPHDDPDDHFDIACLYAISEIDIEGIILDQGEKQKKKPGSIPISQLNHITGRNVPYVAGRRYIRWGSEFSSIPKDALYVKDLETRPFTFEEVPVFVDGQAAVLYEDTNRIKQIKRFHVSDKKNYAEVMTSVTAGLLSEIDHQY